MRRQQTLIFAYGTLRPGCGNDRMLGDYLHVGPATAPGRLYYHTCGMFPVYVRGEPGDVKGDVLLADDRYVAEVLAMEVMAGYNAEWQWVTLHNADEPESVECLTFPWHRPVQPHDHIESGDWYTVPGAFVLPRKVTT